MIPDIWKDYVLKEFHRESVWNAYCEERGYGAAKLPIPPWHKRIKRAFRASVYGARESIAIRLAPWLNPDHQDW